MNARSSVPDSNLHISLAGAEGAQVTSALDEALQKLELLSQADAAAEEASEASPPLRQPTVESSADRLLPLVHAMTMAADRAGAAEQLVKELGNRFPEATIRFGYGASRLGRLFDLQLGWLGQESAIQKECQQRWKTLRDTSAADASLIEPDDFGREPAGPLLELAFQQSDGAGLAVLWMDTSSATPAKATREAIAASDWLRKSSEMLAEVFWSRPLYAWSKSIPKLGRHSKLAAVVVGIMLAIVAVWPMPYRVSCSARVETLKQRMISTPFDASLLETRVEPGDSVRQGQVLVRLDGRPLRLERESIEAEIQQASKEYNAALATGRVADAQQAKLKRTQLSRRFDLLTERLQQLEVVSPIDGVVVSGDLEKHVGSPLKLGQTLLEVAPLNYLQIEIDIPEREIGYVAEDAHVRVKVDAVGGQSMRLQLDSLYPAASLRDDRNVFVGRIKVNNADAELRPGMRGQATLYGPLRPWAWSWLRPGIEEALWWVGY